MKRTELLTIGILPLLLLCLVGFASCHTVDAERYYQLATPLTKLSKAVEATVAFDISPTDTNTDDLMARATEHDPSLLAHFSDYFLHVARQGRHASVLVCTADGAHALLEDAGCTARLDRHAWKETPSPCHTILDLQEICAP